MFSRLVWDSLSDARYVLRAEGIVKSFGRNQVLKSASLWGEAGKVNTLLGRNGSGKTTLMRIAAGSLRADSGVVALMGDARERYRLAAMARAGLMFVPQELLLSPPYRVCDHFQALGATFDSVDVERAVGRFEVEPLMDQKVWSLSGGEKMRVSLALALARAPKVLLIDEPLARLAPKDQEALGQALRALAAHGAAVITSGHDARILLSISDSIIWCVAGTTHHIGSPQEAMAHTQFRRDYLGRSFDADVGSP